VEVDKEGNVSIAGVFAGHITDQLPMGNTPADESYTRKFRYEMPDPHPGGVTLYSRQSSSDGRNENTPSIRFSATLGEEPTVELRLA
jgi:hypothetical protein